MKRLFIEKDIYGIRADLTDCQISEKRLTGTLEDANLEPLTEECETALLSGPLQAPRPGASASPEERQRGQRGQREPRSLSREGCPDS